MTMIHELFRDCFISLTATDGTAPPARLTEGHLVEVLIKAYHERKHLSLSLLDLESITSALGDFLTGAVLVVTVLLLNIVFSTGELAEVAITVSSAILGLSFIFATSAQHTFDSFVFLFVRHPYDVGDRIFLQGFEPMDVVKMELLHTTFRVWNGFILTLPNSTLQSIAIFNYKRCVPAAPSAERADRRFFFFFFHFFLLAEAACQARCLSHALVSRSCAPTLCAPFLAALAT